MGPKIRVMIRYWVHNKNLIRQYMLRSIKPCAWLIQNHAQVILLAFLKQERDPEIAQKYSLVVSDQARSTPGIGIITLVPVDAIHESVLNTITVVRENRLTSSYGQLSWDG